MRRHALLVAVLWLASSGGTCFARPEIWVVTGPDPAHAEFVKSIQGELSARSIAADLRVIPIAQFNDDAPKPEPKSTKLIIATGTSPARAVSRADPAVPILYTLLPRHAYQEVVRAKPRDSAIFLDQPIARQLGLLRAALPRASRIGVVSSPSSVAALNELRAAATPLGLQVSAREIERSNQLLAAMNHVLPESDVFFSLADTLVFNSNTAHHILLTTYRHGVPVLGLSRSYVEAGALVAVHSTPEHIARQLGEMLARMNWSNTVVLPSAQPPRYFTVAVNRRVATALNLSIPPEPVLTQKLTSGGH